MTLPMDNVLNISNLPLRERVQRLFDKNVELENKLRKAAHARIPSDPTAWQQLRENYETIVLEDLAFSEKHELELKLWQLHYRKIEELRAHLSAPRAAAASTSSQNGKGPIRAGPDRSTKIRSQFKTFLSEASGFYHDLMVKIRSKYGLESDYFLTDYGNQNLSKNGNISADLKQSLISCHRCLIYLGDLARYKGSFGEPEFKAREYAAASSYYSQASAIWPSSGNPHHQLAILASYSGDELLTIYRYFRSLSVDNPFTTARDNLTLAFEKNRQSYSQLVGEAKASVNVVRVKMTGKGRGRVSKDNVAEATLVKGRASSLSETLKLFKVRFIRLNGILFTRTSLETFEEVFACAREDLLQLLASGSNEEYNFGSDGAECTFVIIRMVAVFIFTVHNVKKESENQSYAEILQRSLLLQNAYNAVFDFMGIILERCSQLSDLSTSYLLPGILVFVEWLACQQDIAGGIEAEEKQNGIRSFFWNHYILVANKLLSSSGFSEDEDETCFFNMSRYDETETTNRLALFEDFELRGFLPLVPAQQILDFSRKHTFGSDGTKEKQARVHRIIAAGKALANMFQIGQNKIYFDSKVTRFIIGAEPQVSDDSILSSSLEISDLNGVREDNPQSFHGSLKVLEPKPQLYMEEEEEDDEVILFKPIVSDKVADVIPSNPISSDFLGNKVNITEVGVANHVGIVSASYNGLLLQNGLNNSSQEKISAFPHFTTQYMQPAQPTISVPPTTSNWLAEKEVPVIKELANLSFLENRFPMTHELENRFGALQPVNNLSMPFPCHSINASSGIKYPVQLPDTSVASKASTIAPAGLRKNPVSRPVRHSGPPPGFSSVRTKQVEFSMPLQNNNLVMDDYSWLDGYNKLSSSTQGIGFNSNINSNINQQPQLYHSVNKSNNSTAEMVDFPFPGKQIQQLQVQGGEQNGWQQEYQFYQQQQSRNGNQQSTVQPEQYQGQSLWNGHYHV